MIFGDSSLAKEITFSLALGAFSYTMHRATVYPVFYRITARLNHRIEPMIDLDIQRWQHQQESKSLQPLMGEWAAQIHFLYGSALAGLLVLTFSALIGNEKGEKYCLAIGIVIFVYALGFLHHYRYQKMEKRVFEHDRILTSQSRTDNGDKTG